MFVFVGYAACSGVSRAFTLQGRYWVQKRREIVNILLSGARMTYIKRTFHV